MPQMRQNDDGRIQMKEKIPPLGWAWIILLTSGVTIVFLMVNFHFMSKTIKEEMIAHAALPTGIDNVCVCRICGQKSLAYCMKCGSPMQWDTATAHFICPNCKNIGLPKCPNCNVAMVGTAARNKNTVSNRAAVPVF